MRDLLTRRLDGLRGRIARLYGLLLLANLGAWIWALLIFRDHPMLLGTALLAYGFGLRHAVDADHIAAIDNVTRKLMQDGQRPVSIGLYFALGHSAVVILLALAIAATTTEITVSFEALKSFGAVAGTIVSTMFLFLVAAINTVILAGIWKAFRAARAGAAITGHDYDPLLNNRGFLARLLRPLFCLVSRSWHMLPLGFLFGLGFDTATEIGLLGMSATQAGQGMSIWSIMVFPALFAAGMALIDTTDGVLMLGAYDWAFAKPLRKLTYNLVITAVSVIIAVLIGGIEALGLIGDRLGLEGRLWNGIGALNAHFGTLGFAIVSVFIFAWIASVIAYRYARFGEEVGG